VLLWSETGQSRDTHRFLEFAALVLAIGLVIEIWRRPPARR
jgi:hypothetical protein